MQFDVFDLGVLISNISSGITPKVEKDYYTDSSGIPFLRVQNVTSLGIDLSDAKFIKREVHEGMLKRSQLQKDDLVFTITGRIGSTAVVPDNFEGNINQHSVRFHLKAQIENINITPHYIAAFFNSKLGRSLSIREVTGGTRPALDYKALKSLKIILPSPDLQNHIVEIMQSAYAQKRQKDQEADTLLDSIDDYMLVELGIEMPVVEEKKCFVVYANETSGRRGDPHFHQPKYRSFYNMLEAGKSHVVMLANLIKLIYRYPSCYGFSCYDSASDTRVPFLQGEDIDVNEISHEKLIFIEKEISAQYPKTILKEGDLIFSVRGTIGKIALVTHEFENSNISPNLIRLSLDEGVNPQYAEIVLNSKIGQYQINRLTSGGVQPTITKQDILSIEMPLPSLDLQNEIVQEIMRRRSEASTLRQEADAIVESAKREVEQILLEKES